MFEREIAPLYRGDAEAQGHEFPQDPEQEERGPECGPDTGSLLLPGITSIRAETWGKECRAEGGRGGRDVVAA